MTTSQKILILNQHGIETRINDGIIQAKDEYSSNGCYYFNWVSIENMNVYAWLGY